MQIWEGFFAKKSKAGGKEEWLWAKKKRAA